jgi:hypothetical protein
MKKSRILGYALTLAATLVVGSAMGQAKVAGGNDFKKITGTAGEAEEVSLIQINKDYGFYVEPDPAYHPDYNSTKGWKPTANFTWVWDAVTDITATPSTGDLRNYAVLRTAVAGTYSMTVKETPPTGFGCTGSASTFKVVAFDEPSFTLNTPANYNAICGGNTLATVPFSAVITSSGTPTVKYRLEKWSVTINPGTGAKTPNAIITPVVVPNVTETFGTAATGWDFDVAVGQPKTGTVNTKSTITVKSKLDLTNHALATYDFVYTAAIGDLAAPKADGSEGSVIVYRLYIEGVNGLISRKGDLNQQTSAVPAGGYTLYPTTVPDVTLAANYYDVYVSKAPTTGPVYHIGNNVAK